MIQGVGNHALLKIQEQKKKSVKSWPETIQ